MRVYESIASDCIMRLFSSIRGRTLMNHAFNSCGIENMLASASVFCPEVVEVNDCVFISEFYNGNIESLEQRYGGDKKQIEMFVNSWSLADFFLLDDPSVHVDETLEAFGETLCYFWRMRFRELFPERKIVVELGDAIMGEWGLTITVYQEK